MTSPLAERSNWTAPGSDTTAKKTYASIKAALAKIMEQRSVEVFLQGSYANHTNIRDDSDVDIVVMTRQTFSGNPDVLTPYARAEWDRLPAATYDESDLRRDVETALVAYYGEARVHPRNKCIQVDQVSGYVDADVVLCLQYRNFKNSYSSANYVEGIKIFPQHGGSIINFPKEHIKNGEAKNLSCSNRYKQTVRQIKRLRNRAIAEGRLREHVASGYLLECMTFNTPDSKFVYDDSQRLLNVLAWLRYADKRAFLACDHIHYLFIDDPGRFDVDEAQGTLDALWVAL
jgi:predicted nucleotidyltransferase